jgi:hypothetical protein
MMIIKGIASTTHVDTQGDKITKNAQDMMEEKINNVYVPLDIEHSGNYIGVVFCAKVKKLEDEEHGLFIVAGVYENIEERKKYPYGTKNEVYKEYLHLLDEEG